MKWIKSLYNCKCQTVAQGGSTFYKCEWCDNTFWSMRNGFKAIYCKINSWTNQIIKTFQTGNKDNRSWLTYKCPKDTYANQIAAKIGC